MNKMNHYLCRPLVKNIPVMDDSAILTKCPICGQQCWERPELEKDVKQIYDKVIESCTECAIRMGR